MTPPTRTSTHTVPSSNPSPLLLDHLAFSPPSAAPTRPYLFYVHGGGYVTGSRKLVPPYVLGLAQRLGLDLYSVEYRLCPEVGRGEGSKDVRRAWAWVAETRRGEGKQGRGIAWGISAGSYYCLDLIASLPPASRPAAFINFYGSVHVDREAASHPRPVPNPILDSPAGFPALEADLLPQLVTHDGATDTYALKPAAALAQRATSDEYFSLPGSRPIPDADWRKLWAANALSEDLYAYCEAGRPFTAANLARALLLPWALTRGLMADFFDGPQPVPADQPPMDYLAHLASKLAKSAVFPPTLSLHGAADDLVPALVSQMLHGVLDASLPPERGEHKLLLVGPAPAPAPAAAAAAGGDLTHTQGNAAGTDAPEVDADADASAGAGAEGPVGHGVEMVCAWASSPSGGSAGSYDEQRRDVEVWVEGVVQMLEGVQA